MFKYMITIDDICIYNEYWYMMCDDQIRLVVSNIRLFSLLATSKN